MSRSNYTCDNDIWAQLKWRGMVASAIRGNRGQRMLRELADALDAMPSKRLIQHDLVTRAGECCTLGAVFQARGRANTQEELHEDNARIANELNVSECLVQEVEFLNDDAPFIDETPEARWTRMRAWVGRKLAKGKAVPDVV